MTSPIERLLASAMGDAGIHSIISHGAWGLIAGAVSLAGFAPYLLLVARGHARPRLITWTIWALVSASLCVTYRSVGADTTIWAALSFVVGPILVVLLGLRCGSWRWTAIDRMSVLAWAAAEAFSAWSTSFYHALLLGIGVDLLGSAPMIAETFRETEERDWAMWSMFLLGGLCNLAALKTADVNLVVYPLYLALVPLFMCCLLLRAYAKQRITRSGRKLALTVLPAD